MSGHSKWSSIKHQKAATDQKRGKVFAKLARIIAIAAKEGADPSTNARLRSALQTAREWNVPKDNIARAIRKGTGEERGGELEEVLYEAFGPGGAALLISAITDNRNRTSSELKHILGQCDGKLSGEGSVRWQFDLKGVLTVQEAMSDELLKAAIDAGADDIRERTDGAVDILTSKENLDAVRKELEKAKKEITDQSLEWLPKNAIETVSEEAQAQLDHLFSALDEREDVQEIYSNLTSTSEQTS